MIRLSAIVMHMTVADRKLVRIISQNKIQPTLYEREMYNDIVNMSGSYSKNPLRNIRNWLNQYSNNLSRKDAIDKMENIEK
ncbi:MAG: hypothetical protein LKG27_03220 [Clostridiaceae bacterium]|jgi:hypothetical protein|nr:hypothetical protein [Clostridiaceae bacterium]